MENSYGIGVTNRYALFLDDDADPLEVLKVQEQEKELKKKSKVSEKENKGKIEVISKTKIIAPQKKTLNNKAQDIKRDENKPISKSLTDIKTEKVNKIQNVNETREERNNKRNKDERAFNGQLDGNREEKRRDYGDNIDSKNRGRAMGRPRGRGGRVHDQRGKREYDRQSGSDKTGVKPVDKREGGGAHNWGSDRDVINEGEKIEPADPTLDLDKIDNVNSTTEVKELITGEIDITSTEEPKLITLDEWRAQRGNRQKPQYNLRKAGEGEDPTQWKKMYELNKKKEGEEDESEDEGYDASDYPQRVGRQKHILDINIHFYEDRRGGGPGAGRGRGRNGPRGGGRVGTGPVKTEREPRERTGPRPFRGPEADREIQGEEPNTRVEYFKGNKQNTPKVDDEKHFPSLS